MTTTGELLVSLSDLETGTALEHLMNITGSGGGPGETVYVDRLADVNTLEFEAAEGLGLGGGEELELGASDTVALELGTDLALDGDGDLEIS